MALSFGEFFGLVAVIWLVRTHLRNQKLRHEGQELCRKSLENK